MSIPLEDSVTDIIGKAQRGTGFSDSDVARKVGVAESELEAIKKISGVDFALVEKLGRVLELGPRSLVAIADGTYQPDATAPKTGFFMSNTPFGDMRVNAYLIWDAESGLAAAFDTGADCSELVQELQKRSLTLQDIYLTHTHADHVMELDRLVEKAGGGSIGIHVNEAEALEGAASFRPGATFSLGALSIETRDTAGHSAGGTTYHVHGLDRPVTIVGDALFAGSVGGIKSDYRTALRKIRDHILSTPDGTILAPGHGPLTTTALEKKNNPFFPGFRRTEAQGI